MTRWREPRAASSPYITAEGYRVLQADLRELWQRRGAVTRALAAAAAEGDRSENAEYLYRKRELRDLDARIAYLQRRLPTLQIVHTVGNQAQVFFGARVVLEQDDGSQHCYRIVGADELGEDTQNISVDSPLAKALLGKSSGDEVRIETAARRQSYYIVAIQYGPREDQAPGEG